MLERLVDVTRKKCIHHWVIETANGPTSKGVCGGCGAAKDFDNSIKMPEVNHISLEKNEEEEPTPSRTSWMQSWPSANMKDGLK
tara:strand:+ start:343 stop:594 length:252 start_codon:yes stop_codon:yes gene_type:complete